MRWGCAVVSASMATPARSSAWMNAVRAKAWASVTRNVRTVGPLPASIVP